MIANFDVLFIIIFFMLDNNSQEIKDLISLYNLGDLKKSEIKQHFSTLSKLTIWIMLA